MLKPGMKCLIIGGCKLALGKEVLTVEFKGTVEGTNDADYWEVAGWQIPVWGHNGEGATQNWAYVRDPHLMPIDPDPTSLPVKEEELVE